MKKFLVLLTFFLAIFSTLVSACDVLEDCSDTENTSVSSFVQGEQSSTTSATKTSNDHHCICSMSCNQFLNSFHSKEEFIVKEDHAVKINSFYSIFFEEVYLSFEKPPLV